MGLHWHADWLGWLAAALMVATFGCREARCMRPLAVATNLAFIGYGLTAALAPVLALHALLLPINLWRWWECTRHRLPSLHPHQVRSRPAANPGHPTAGPTLRETPR
jgi:hypothetical protein